MTTPTAQPLSAEPGAPQARPSHPAVARLGDAGARLLSGPPAIGGPESLAGHVHRLGPLPLGPAATLMELVRTSGLQGRGGGEFPLARKLTAAVDAGGPAIVVANGSEGEPASRKDRLLLEHRPHLVLDGLAVAAAAVGAPDAVVYLHGTRARTRQVLEAAIAERAAAGVPPVPVGIVSAPDRFVAGESSAVVAFLEARDPRPRRTGVPAAVRGAFGRPTVVSNVETLAHVGLLVRTGADWFRQAGSGPAPGSSLLTLGGAVAEPGSVVEVTAPVPIGTVLSVAGGLTGPPAAVLLGGYGGTWMGGEAAWAAPVDRATLRAAGFPLGCGLVAALPQGACGLAVTARLLAYLATQSAGQCGTCVHGLPALADTVADLAAGAGTRADVRRLLHGARGIRGSGGCAHPDGAVSLVESALTVFAGDLHHHVRRRPCAANGGEASGWFPTPSVPFGVVGP